MKFLEFIGLLLILYIFTQQFLPAIMPSKLETNWFFKKKKPIDEKVQDISNKKELLDNQIDEVKSQIQIEADKVKKAEEKVNKLNN